MGSRCRSSWVPFTLGLWCAACSASAGSIETEQDSTHGQAGAGAAGSAAVSGAMHGGSQLVTGQSGAQSFDDDPAPDDPALPPLLGSSHGGHVWNRFCADHPDDAKLPVDPRTLVQPGIDADRAVQMNAYWVSCHDDGPKTCGEYRAGLARGKQMMEGGRMWFFGGDHSDASMTISASDYNAMWLDWGLAARPQDFDQRVAERWGVPLGERRNPYPLPGEDPNKTGGGSGQLPVALTQLTDESGRYLSKLSFNCHWCHSGKVGEPGDGPGLGALYGSGNSLLDISASFGKFGGGSSALLPAAANKVRGTGNILIYPLIAGLDVDRAQHYNESLLAAPSQGSVDYPAWWNVGHRTRRFHDGSFAMDDARPVMGFFMPLFTASRTLDIAGGREWIDERDQDVQLWLESLSSPAYPGAIDEWLARRGARIFHEKNLWSAELENPTPAPPGGNGSCAGCHGTYSPRYAHDSRFLAQPELEGIAAFVAPLDVIGTDSARLDSLTDRLADTLQYSWWSYGENDTKGKCFAKITPAGYLAPPLYGVWASAPYFHNGSVPNVWEVLQPLDRKPIWRRVSTPAPEDEPHAFTGFDTDLARAYDHDKLGWRYDALPCGTPAQGPALDCSRAGAETDPIANALTAGGAASIWFSWNLAPQPLDAAALEARKIYNTHAYSQSNRGHLFTVVLTDDERRALIEYLKTL